MAFDFGEQLENVLDKIVGWERLVAEYEAAAQEKIGTSILCAVMLGKMPGDLRTHLLLTTGQRPDYGMMKAAVESYIVARRRWTRSELGGSTSTHKTPMEIDALFKKRKREEQG